MKYLTKEQILLIHSMVVDETGGSHGVRDRHLLLSLDNSPRQGVFGKELYPTVHEKAAVYARDTTGFRPFVDGNKRTAMTAASVFLEDNGYNFIAKKGEIEKMALRTVSEKLNIKEIAVWLKKHSKKI